MPTPTIPVDPEVAARFARLTVRWILIDRVRVGTNTPALETLRKRVVAGARSRHEAAKDASKIPTLAAFHAGLRESGIDPNRSRPWLDDLFRVVSRGDPFPVVNDAVDLARLAALAFAVPVVALDPSRLSPPLQLRLAPPGTLTRTTARTAQQDLSGRPVLVDRNGPVASPVSGLSGSEPVLSSASVGYAVFLPTLRDGPDAEEIDRWLGAAGRDVLRGRPMEAVSP